MHLPRPRFRSLVRIQRGVRGATRAWTGRMSALRLARCREGGHGAAGGAEGQSRRRGDGSFLVRSGSGEGDDGVDRRDAEEDAGRLGFRRRPLRRRGRSEEHTSELQSLMRISYAVFCLKKKKKITKERLKQEQKYRK